MPEQVRHDGMEILRNSIARGSMSAMRERNPFVYIMANRFNGTVYVGVTSNLLVRVLQHREGAFDGFTKRHGIKRLVWFDTVPTMIEAIAAEKRIKKWPRQWKRNIIEPTNPRWKDLAIDFGLPPLD